MWVTGSFTSPVNTSKTLPTTLWSLPPSTKKSSASGASVPDIPCFTTVHHLRLSSARNEPGLLDFLHSEFVKEIARGLSYPHDMGEATRNGFEDYFFAESVFLGIMHEGDVRGVKEYGEEKITDGIPMKEVVLSVEDARAGRDWADCLTMFFYICNGGVIASTAVRGRGYGQTLGPSFMYYGPRLGYAAVIFNLVFVNNLPSIRLWESLKFQKIGLIPRAGRVARPDGRGVDFVDAITYYKDFRGLEGFREDLYPLRDGEGAPKAHL
ncbi:hypothetical protein BD410DRAFT_897860 [Rickenella mellea]|uniref:N-acetyltransferase domain-containing protein n=1 Tax=Rickenella mellea TaxID=50990 RepID=A0A4Y7Q6F3_9AGAM|nr:hypothetical protein BD410DRAFT_897860 [Rickenella mellea]